MDGATVVGIRYDYHEDDGKIVSSNIVMIVDLVRTLEDITQMMKEDWEPENDVYLIGYEESETTDAPLYDDSITIESIHSPGLVLVFSSIPPSNDDLK